MTFVVNILTRASFQMSTEPRHPIGVASSRTGIPQDLLRAWEKRYNAVVPGRGPTGRRLYSDEDINKLRLLKKAVTAGRRISDVAALSTEELKELTHEDQAETAHSTAPTPASSPEGHLQTALDAIESLDPQGLERALNVAAVSLSAPQLRQRMIMPLLQAIGERWREGKFRVVHEHLASAIVRSFLAGQTRPFQKHPSAPRVIVTTPAGQRHEFGALAVAGAAEDLGWNAIYLGPDMPAEEIAAAARHFEPRAVALSIIYKNGDVQVQEEVRKLIRYLDSDVAVIVGGRAVEHLRSFFDDLGVKSARDLAEFQDQLSDFSDPKNIVTDR